MQFKIHLPVHCSNNITSIQLSYEQYPDFKTDTIASLKIKYQLR